MEVVDSLFFQCKYHVAQERYIVPLAQHRAEIHFDSSIDNMRFMGDTGDISTVLRHADEGASSKGVNIRLLVHSVLGHELSERDLVISESLHAKRLP